LSISSQTRSMKRSGDCGNAPRSARGTIAASSARGGVSSAMTPCAVSI